MTKANNSDHGKSRDKHQEVPRGLQGGHRSAIQDNSVVANCTSVEQHCPRVRPVTDTKPTKPTWWLGHAPRFVAVRRECHQGEETLALS